MHTNRRTLAMLAALGSAVPLGFVLPLAILAAALGIPGAPSRDDESDTCVGKLAAGTTVDGQALDAEQITNAGLIVAAGQHLGIPEPGETIALATAMQESGLHNLNYGDRDSLGLFQQRPSQGWGTASQIMDPTYSATAFYKAPTQVSGWAAMPTTDAAQAVQRSAYPDAYAKWAQLAHDLATTLDGTCTRGSGPTPPAPAGYQIPPGTPAPITAVIDFALKQLGKPYQYGDTGPDTWDCSGLIQAPMPPSASRSPVPPTTRSTPGPPSRPMTPPPSAPATSSSLLATTARLPPRATSVSISATVSSYTPPRPATSAPTASRTGYPASQPSAACSDWRLDAAGPSWLRVSSIRQVTTIAFLAA
jgi:hypothetical protein